MFAKINHIAIMSSNFSLQAQFYEILFDMKRAEGPSQGAITVGDGYVGLNINPRKPGRPGGLDHFGVQVKDVESVFERMEKNYPKIKWLKRPSSRPYAGITTHDPDGNLFDLSQAKMKNRRGIYTAGEWEQERAISHFALRTLNPEKCAEFYCDVLQLSLANREEGDENYYVTDGRITIVLAPWDITNYANTGISRAGPDHFAFKVKSLDAFKESYQAMIERNLTLIPPPVGMGPEGKARLKFLRRIAPYTQHHLADHDSVLIGVSE